MSPVLIEIGPITLYTYGLLVASGFLLGIAWSARLARREGMDPQSVYDTAFWMILAAVIGSRIFYVAINLDYYLENPIDVFKLWEGGLVFYGGFVGAAIAVIFSVRRYRLDLWAFGDVAAPGAALGHAIGRLGCFFAGCCYGKQTSVPWAVTFHDPHSIAPLGIPLHPTQLYSAANEFALFALLTAIRPWRSFRGQILWIWVGLYAVGRFTIEIFRGDPRGVYFGGLASTSQIIAVFAFAAAVYFYFRNRKRHPLR
ncbi:MAG: prolipoprotein diacylglyceryl transferase [Candidatus Nitrospinota bacterium M3_3B_026]